MLSKRWLRGRRENKKKNWKSLDKGGNSTGSYETEISSERKSKSWLEDWKSGDLNFGRIRRYRGKCWEKFRSWKVEVCERVTKGHGWYVAEIRLENCCIIENETGGIFSKSDISWARFKLFTRTALSGTDLRSYRLARLFLSFRREKARLLTLRAFDETWFRSRVIMRNHWSRVTSGNTSGGFFTPFIAKG